MENYKNKLGNLADKLKQERPATPIQEVIPVKAVPVTNEPEVQFNNRIPKGVCYGDVDHPVPGQIDHRVS